MKKRTLGPFLMVWLAITGCGMGPSKKKNSVPATPPTEEPNGEDDATAGDDAALKASQEAFATTTYPLLNQYCGGCHATDVTPLIAQEDTALAHDTTVEAQKVNFEKVELSRLYLRLAKENHNCWSDCEENAAEMLAALTEWARVVQENSQDNPDAPVGLITNEISFKDAPAADLSQDPTLVVAEAENATVTAPMIKFADAKASGGMAIHVPTGSGGTVANGTTVGTAVFNLAVKQAGTYQLWVRLRTPSATNSGLYISVDNGAFATWDMPESGEDFKWMRGETIVNAMPRMLTYNLTAGNHRVEIRRREENTQVDVVALSMDPQFDGDSATPGYKKTLRYSLDKMLGGQPVFFEVDVIDFDASSYKFKNPRLVVDQGSIHIAGVHLRINGQTDPLSATYSLVDTTVAAPGGIISTAALIALKHDGSDADTFSFEFEILEKQ